MLSSDHKKGSIWDALGGAGRVSLWDSNGGVACFGGFSRNVRRCVLLWLCDYIRSGLRL